MDQLKPRNQLPVDLTPFHKIMNDLSLRNEGLILRDNGEVVPKSLQPKMIQLAQSGHQGIQKTKKLIRAYVWFPGIDKITEEAVKSCKKCQVNTNSQRLVPLKMSKMQDRRWEELYGELKNGKYVFVLIDDHLSYPISKIIQSTSAKQVTHLLDEIFSTFGVPKVLKIDNGPQFNGQEFKED